MQAILFTSILFALVSGLYTLRSGYGPQVILWSFIGLSLVSELTAYYMATNYRNNMPVFHFFSPVLFALLCLYFNRISPTVSKYNLAYFSLIACVAISALNSAYFQPIHTMNSNYLLLEGLFGCGMALIALYDFLRDDNNPFIYRSIHFWMTLTMLFHYLGTYIVYLVILLLKEIGAGRNDLVTAYTFLWLIAVLTYIAVGVTFMLFPAKKIKNG